MGQFLAIGLALKMTVGKKGIEAAQISIGELQEKMKKELHYIPEIYVVRDEGDYYSFILKDDILYTQLIPFLETIYPLLYDNSRRYDNIIKKLKILTPSEWLQWADGKPEEEFQIDQYGMQDFIDISQKRISVNYHCLMLSMEGKIFMEEFGRQFKFLKYTMMQTFKQFSIAGALRIYITG